MVTAGLRCWDGVRAGTECTSPITAGAADILSSSDINCVRGFREKPVLLTAGRAETKVRSWRPRENTSTDQATERPTGYELDFLSDQGEGIRVDGGIRCSGRLAGWRKGDLAEWDVDRALFPAPHRDTTARGHVEVRWSHGRFVGASGAKVYLDTPPMETAGYTELI